MLFYFTLRAQTKQKASLLPGKSTRGKNLDLKIIETTIKPQPMTQTNHLKTIKIHLINNHPTPQEDQSKVKEIKMM